MGDVTAEKTGLVDGTAESTGDSVPSHLGAALEARIESIKKEEPTT